MSNKTIESLVAEICEIESSISKVDEDIRDKVKREGKRLLALQKEQKKEQEAAKSRGEPAQTWKEFVEDQKRVRDSFPHEANCRKYMRIVQYPGAYESGMSVKEAYKMATKWKKNGGNPPPTAKVSIKTRLPNQIGNAVGRAVNKLVKYNSIEDWSDNAKAEKWSSDDFAGMEETLTAMRKEISIALNKLKKLREVSHV